MARIAVPRRYTPPVLSRSFCSSVDPDPAGQRHTTPHLAGGFPEERPGPCSDLREGPDLSRCRIHRDLNLPFIVFVEEEPAAGPGELRRALHERQLLRHLALDVRNVGCLQRQFRRVGVDEEPVVGSSIGRQAVQRRRAVQLNSQFGGGALLGVLPGRQVARAHLPQAGRAVEGESWLCHDRLGVGERDAVDRPWSPDSSSSLWAPNTTRSCPRPAHVSSLPSEWAG